jgi:hypothetical protein
MEEAKRVYWSVEECGWVDCPAPVAEADVPRQRTEEPVPVVLTES